MGAGRGLIQKWLVDTDSKISRIILCWSLPLMRTPKRPFTRYSSSQGRMVEAKPGFGLSIAPGLDVVYEVNLIFIL